MAGAAPNETRSARESSSFPIALSALILLAILPSYLSTKAAHSIITAERLKLFVNANIIANIPKVRLVNVNKLGMTFLFII
jgi:hypothetical protein